MNLEYTTVAKLISRGSKMVNAVGACDRTMHSRVSCWGHSAPYRMRTGRSAAVRLSGLVVTPFFKFLFWSRMACRSLFKFGL